MLRAPSSEIPFFSQLEACSGWATRSLALRMEGPLPGSAFLLHVDRVPGAGTARGPPGPWAGCLLLLFQKRP